MNFINFIASWFHCYIASLFSFLRSKKHNNNATMKQSNNPTINKNELHSRNRHHATQRAPRPAG